HDCVDGRFSLGQYFFSALGAPFARRTEGKMDFGAIRPPHYTVIAPVGSGFETTIRPQSTTDLPAEKTVSPSAEVVATRGTADKGRSGRSDDTPAVKREDYQDDATGTLVFRAINTETGQVLRQVPAE